MSRIGLADTGFFMGGKLKYYIILHLIVLIWGITGILGDEISLSADKITFFRTLISLASLLIVGVFLKKRAKITLNQEMQRFLQQELSLVCIGTVFSIQ